jgi:hypothetical protein
MEKDKMRSWRIKYFSFTILSETPTQRSVLFTGAAGLVRQGAYFPKSYTKDQIENYFLQGEQ